MAETELNVAVVALIISYCSRYFNTTIAYRNIRFYGGLPSMRRIRHWKLA
jgi:hypothetical protein